MTASAFRHLLRQPLLLLGVLCAGAASAAAQGIVSGRLTDQANGAPLVGARIVILGTSLTATSTSEGRYRITGVPAGAQQVRASQIGYASGTKSVTVPDQSAVTADFALVLTPYSLDEVVVTATGDQAKREVGNSVSTVDVADLVKTSSITNMNDLLVGKAPGVQVLPGSLTGAGARVRIRGASSLSLSNEPIYVVDGIRVTSAVNSAAISIGGTNPSRVNDLNPEDIESIDVVKGPSASTLYGTDAANGVIVIKTKRGRAGKPVWSASMEQGGVFDRNKYPLNYRAWTAGSAANNTTQCFLSGVAAKTCVQDSVSKFDAWKDPESSPLGTGHRQEYSLQVSGGTDALRYYISGDWEKEIGVLRMPQIFQQRILAARALQSVPSYQVNPNALRKMNVRANLNVNLNERMDLALSSGFVTSTQRLPQTDNNTTGLGSNLYGGSGFKHNIVNPPGAATTFFRDNYGYQRYTPDEFFSDNVNQDINRTITSATYTYRPTSWLSTRAVIGMDFTSREDNELCIRDQCTYFASSATDPSVGSKAGFRTDARTTFFNYTGDINATATYKVMADVGGKTIVGGQYGKEKFTQGRADASNLTPGGRTVSSGSIPSVSEATTISATLGFFAEQSLSYKDRLYLTGAVRTDKNSAFGTGFQRVYYPKASLSYVVSDEPFFPRSDVLSSLRFRGAYGASGRQPGPNDAAFFLTSTTSNVDNVDTPALVVSAVGNPGLKPERTAELEVGFDASLASNRVNLEMTYYKKTSRDALISRTIAPSAGTPATRFENIGKTANEGIEFAINSTIVDSKSFGWELTLGGSYNRNKIVSLGTVPLAPGVTNWSREGYPIGAWWTRPYTYQDLNKDGIIAFFPNTVVAGVSTPDPRNELFIKSTDSLVYNGPVLPPGEFTAFNAFDLFGRKLRIQALLSANVGGYTEFDTERIRCQSRFNCRGDLDPTASLKEQAAAVAVRQAPSSSQFGYVFKTDFVRLRELSATYTFPDKWAHLLSASRVSLTVAGRNLGIITRYPGIDPETGYFASTGAALTNDFQTAPPPSYFTFRLNVGF
ncbi:MAG TPA: SusC/RagA family TonB-linked outer membrane protein [Gemmatimonadales bacterium]